MPLKRPCGGDISFCSVVSDANSATRNILCPPCRRPGNDHAPPKSDKSREN